MSVTTGAAGVSAADDNLEQSRTVLAELLASAILDSMGGGAADSDGAEHVSIVGRTAEAEVVVRELLQQAVATARAGGHSWAAIGAELNLSRQAVQQRFGVGATQDLDTPPGHNQAERWLGPVTAFDELRELEIAGRLGWHTVEAGMLRHRMVKTATQWEHKRVLRTAPAMRRLRQEGWSVGCNAFPWVYLIRDLGVPAEEVR